MTDEYEAGNAADETEENERRSDTPGPAGITVPTDPPDPAETEHVLPSELLQYPTFEFDDGEVTDSGVVELEADLDREIASEWLTDLAGGIESHDVGFRAPAGTGIFGVGTPSISLSFEPEDEDFVGELSVTVTMPAKLLTVSSDPDVPVAGARGSMGFIPLEMLTSDRSPDEFRCYNWIDEPVRESVDEGADAPGGAHTDGETDDTCR